MERGGLRVTGEQGVIYNLFADEWQLSGDMDVNYMLTAERASPSLLWMVFTVLAAAGQTARNAMQRELTATLGTVGATHVRFLFGFPFALIFLAVVLIVTGMPLPRPRLVYWPWIVARRRCADRRHRD